MDSGEEAICEEYESSLEDLTFNSKPLINVLTMLAEENSQFASSITKLIANRIYQVCRIYFSDLLSSSMLDDEYMFKLIALIIRRYLIFVNFWCQGCVTEFCLFSLTYIIYRVAAGFTPTSIQLAINCLQFIFLFYRGKRQHCVHDGTKPHKHVYFSFFKVTEGDWRTGLANSK